MKTEELEKLGLSKEQIDAVMKQNGLDIEKVKGDFKELQDSNEILQKNYEAAQEVLKKYEGLEDVDIRQLQEDVKSYRTAAETAKQEYEQKIAERDFSDLVTKVIRDAGGLNEKAIKSLLDWDTLKNSKNQNSDVIAAVNALKEKEDSYMLFKSEGKHASFTTQVGSNRQPTKTKEEIMAIKDTAERQAAIAENISLFQ